MKQFQITLIAAGLLFLAGCAHENYDDRPAAPAGSEAAETGNGADSPATRPPLEAPERAPVDDLGR